MSLNALLTYLLSQSNKALLSIGYSLYNDSLIYSYRKWQSIFY